MQYGNLGLNKESLFLYMGSNPANDNSSFIDDNRLPSFSRAVNQRDADLLYFWNKVVELIFFDSSYLWKIPTDTPTHIYRNNHGRSGLWCPSGSPMINLKHTLS